MARTPMAEKPMTDKERRRKSNAEKLRRGEHHLTMWLGPDAAAALRRMTGDNPARGAIKDAVETAIIKTAARIK